MFYQQCIFSENLYITLFKNENINKAYLQRAIQWPVAVYASLKSVCFWFLLMAEFQETNVISYVTAQSGTS